MRSKEDKQWYDYNYHFTPKNQLNRKIYMKQYNIDNRKKLNEYLKKWRKNNKDKCLEYNKKRREKYHNEKTT